MRLDIRFPIGLMFAVLGVILTVYGAMTASSAELYRRSLEININLWCGLIFLAFGLGMLLLARGSRKAANGIPDEPDAEDRPPQSR